MSWSGGLWDRWERQSRELIESLTILTTDANELVVPIRARMLAVLAEEDL